MFPARIIANQTIPLPLFQGTEIITHDDIHLRKALEFQILFVFTLV